MNYRMLKKGEHTKPTDERKISGPNEPEKWETSILEPGGILVETDGMYRRQCDDETYRLFRACEIVMAAATKFCLKEFFRGPLGVLFRMQEDKLPVYTNEEKNP